jgi:sodium-dependent dicarboxylate transporter 2/3/5
MLLPAWVLLLFFFPPEKKTISRTREELKLEYKNLPPMSRNEKSSLFNFCLTILLWLVSKPLGNLAGMRIPTSMPALLGACLFFFPGMTDIKWKKVQDDVSWSGILLIASGVSLGLLMYTTGAAKWIATLLLSDIGRMSPMLQILSVILIVSVLKLGLSSNTVTATVTMPILIALAEQQNITPLAVVIPAAMTMNVAYILVTSTPTSVIPYTTGYFSISEMAKPGIIMTLVSAAVLTPLIYLIGRLGGIY